MKEFVKKHKWEILLCVYALLMISLHFFRIFDNYFWGDEAYTIRLAKMSIPDMFRETALDVHPPLYYMIVKLFCTVLGFHGPVYHLVSLLAYLGIVALSLTYIQKRFGILTAFLLLSLSSILPNTFTYNVEVRMYSYGALFVLLSYLFLQRILYENKISDYILFAAFSAAAAYTHYYCLVNVAFFYLFLIIYSIVKRKGYLVKTMVCSVCTILCYLPWFFVLFTTFKRSSEDFWMMWIPTLRECLEYLFAGKLNLVIFGLFMGSLILFAVSNAIAVKKKDCDRDDFIKKSLWIFAGFMTVFGTMFIGIMVSRIVRPLFITRYLYPVCVIAWFLFGYLISEAKIKGRSIIVMLILALVIISSYKDALSIIKKDLAESNLLETTLSVTDGEMQKEDIILTNQQNMDWTLSDYYYPDVPHVLVSAGEFPDLDPSKTYWIMITPESASDFEEVITGQGFRYECRIENGIMGTTPLSIYKAYMK